MGRRGQWTLAICAAAGLGAAADVSAQTPAPAAESAGEELDDIIVLAPESETRIDRRTYTIRDDPAAQTNNMLDVLGRIPSVSVDPNGVVRLLGAEGVTVQINSQPVPPENLEQTLRTLNADEIERIEVITNPSAQFSSQGTAGIINIITRHSFNSGFGGSIFTSVDTLGSTQGNLAPTWTSGPWSLGGRLGLGHNLGDSAVERVRRELGTGDVTTEDGDGGYESEVMSANLRGAYNFNTRDNISLTLDHFDADNTSWQFMRRTQTSGSDEEQARATLNDFAYDAANFAYQNENEDGRSLKLNAYIDRFDSQADSVVTVTPANGDPLSQFATLTIQETANASLNLDFERPLSESRMLTLGGTYDRTEQDNRNVLDTRAGDGPSAYDTRLNGVQETYAAYGTYQFATGDWTWLPGLRAEHLARQIEASAIRNEADDTRLFPSLHIRRKLSEYLDLDLSYSSRIQWPGFYQLDPSVRFFESNRAAGGNPDLEPTTTDAYEANLTYQDGGTTYGLTFYDRISDDIVSQITELRSDGVLFTTSVNAGESEQRGVQAILRAPLSPYWRYSLSANAQGNEFDVLNGAALERQSAFEYSGNATLEFRDPDQALIGADHVQLDFQFQGPRELLQGEMDAFVMTNLTWRRRLTDRLSSIITWSDVFDSNRYHSETITDTYAERVDYNGVGPRVRFALTYRFGAGRHNTEEEQQPATMQAPMPQ